MRFWQILSFGLALLPCASVFGEEPERRRVIIETDAGGDPDDEQSLVRFLLYANEWDVEGMIFNRAEARERENLNPERTGLGIGRRLIQAYAACYPKLVQHDPRYPTPEQLLSKAVAGYNDTDDGVQLILKAVDRDDPRPIWYSDWGSDRGSGIVNMKRALDRVWTERGPEEYAKFKQRLRLSSYDQFGEHTTLRGPPFPLWVNTFQPPIDGKRWYHRFSAITSQAGGFDLKRDVLTGHGPLGALYPTNTTHTQKEGDSMTFLYLVPTGMNDPEQPTWGSWAGRYGPHPEFPGRPYYWANQEDTWQGKSNRDNTLLRWAAHLQNDFQCRLDWCVRDFSDANHPPRPSGPSIVKISATSGASTRLNVGEWTDPDGDSLRYEWIYYPEPGSYRGEPPTITGTETPAATFTAPEVASPQTLHFVLCVTDAGAPALTRYGRVVVEILPRR